MSWLVFAGYVAGFLWCYRKVYLMFANDEYFGEHNDDPFDRSMNIFMSMGAGLFWPIVGVGILLHRFATPVSMREREEAVRLREENIARMERENGIT